MPFWAADVLGSCTDAAAAALPFPPPAFICWAIGADWKLRPPFPVAPEEAPGGAAGNLQLGDVVATLGGDGERTAALLQQPVEVVPAPLALVAVPGHDRHGTDVLENRAGRRRELLARGTLSRRNDERGKGQREVVRDDPSARARDVNVRIDKGASTPRDGIQARGDEPENIRKTSDSIFAYRES